MDALMGAPIPGTLLYMVLVYVCVFFSHTFTFQLLDKSLGHRCRPFFPPVLAFNF